MVSNGRTVSLSKNPLGLRPSGTLRIQGHRSAYLLGIGGTGMSGAAQLLRARGLEVRGSDAQPGDRTARLRDLGVGIDPSEDPALLPSDLDLVVCSAAIPRDHPQLLEAMARGVDVWKYADVLGALMADRFGISVAGCHGKTTTSALVSSALVRAGRDPSFVVGGELREFGSGARSGSGPCFVAEACEFDRSFHRHRPRVAVVTNVDADHLDYFRDLEEIREAFRVFASLVPADGVLVVHEDHAPLFEGDPRIAARTETFGTSRRALWRAGEPVLVGSSRRMLVPIARDGWTLGTFDVPLIGAHNALNAAAAVAVLHAVGLDVPEIANGLAGFGGVGRRLDLVHDRGGILVFDDYGHHPAEIRAVVAALRRRYEGRRIVVIFQPHQASRTRHLIDEFADALATADEAWLPPIYFARDGDEDRRAISSHVLAERVRLAGGQAVALSDLGATVDHAAVHVGPGDVVVTMGAGNVDEVARGLAQRLR
jgi:UDP-N-acetylmuramate--alanine ligase